MVLFKIAETDHAVDNLYFLPISLVFSRFIQNDNQQSHCGWRFSKRVIWVKFSANRIFTDPLLRIFESDTD
jgi:hypothetical protein